MVVPPVRCLVGVVHHCRPQRLGCHVPLFTVPPCLPGADLFRRFALRFVNLSALLSPANPALQPRPGHCLRASANLKGETPPKIHPRAQNQPPKPLKASGIHAHLLFLVRLLSYQLNHLSLSLKRQSLTHSRVPSALADFPLGCHNLTLRLSIKTQLVAFLDHSSFRPEE